MGRRSGPPLTPCRNAPPMLDVDAEIRRALKAKDHAALTGYRSLKAKVSNKLTEAGRDHGQPLSEAELTALIQREIKERTESNEYLPPERPEHAENARIVALLSAHLPEALEGEALEGAIRKAIADTQAAGPRDMGKVMAALRQVPGVDMATASGRVKEVLQQGA